MLIVVATSEEYDLAKQKFRRSKIIKTGVGAVNVIKALSDIDRKIKLLNFGYVGSNILAIGTEVEVGEARLYHPNVEYREKVFKIGEGVTCFTSCDFVLKTNIAKPCVFDMELVFILAMGFKNVRSIKTVSDNLSLKEYKENVF